MKKIQIICILISIFVSLFTSDEITISSPNEYRISKYVEFYGKDALVSQIPISETNRGHCCQFDSVYPYESDICDDITVPSDEYWDIDSIQTWWYNWSGWLSWALVPNIYFIIYPDSSGQPADSPIIEVVVEKSDYSVYETNPYSVVIDISSRNIRLYEGRYWIEVQPSNVFTSNGQTGIQEQVGIGNLLESYNRFPLLGINNWQTATETFGYPYGMSFVIWGSSIPGGIWDFEDGWQNWTHTNGAVFPGGWSVISSSYTVGSWTIAPPNADDSCFCIDSDGAGGWLLDTAKSPFFIAGADFLYWGIHFQDFAGRDTIEVLLRKRTGGSWEPWTVIFAYGSDTPPTTDSVEVSAFIDTLQIAFFYEATDWDWFAAFDNVGPYYQPWYETKNYIRNAENY